MLKKSLIFGSIAVLAALLLITGCSNPTSSSGSSENEEENNNTGNNNNGGNGTNPGADDFISVDPVSAAALAEKFAKYSTVTLGGNITRVEGEIPAGKTLIITGANTMVAPTGTLAVKGSIEIKNTALLDASYTTGQAGYLTGSGQINGLGTVSLPYLQGSSAALPVADGISLENAKGTAKKAAGSIITTSSGTGTAVANANLPALFAAVGDELSVANIIGLTNAWATGNRTLTLAGTNTIGTTLDLSSGGNLIVNGTISSDNVQGVVIKAKATPSNVTINGILDLTDDVADNVEGLVTNNGIIKTETTTPAVLQKLLTGVTGTGTVEVGDTVTLVSFDTTQELLQNVSILPNVSLTAPAATTPFSGGKTITLTDDTTHGATLALGDTPTSFGVKVVNNAITDGGITTATTSATFLNTVLGVGNLIGSTGVVDTTTVGITVPVGTKLTSSGALVGGSTPLTIRGTASFTGASFGSQTAAVIIEQGADVTFGTGATFAALNTPLIINGKATFSPNTVTFAALPSLTVEVAGDVEFTAAEFASLDIPITINGKATFSAATFVQANSGLTIGPKANATFTLATFAALTSLTFETGTGAAATVSFPEATFAALSGSLTIPASVTVNGDGFPEATFAALGSIAINQDLALPKATFVALTTLTANADITIGTTSVVAPVNNLTVGGSGTVEIGTQGLTIAAEQKLTNNGKIVLDDSAGKLVLSTGSGPTISKLDGTGTLTAGATVISGEWETVGTDTGTVTITAAATGATIAAATNASALKASDDGVGTITQKNTIASSFLKIAESTEIALGGTSAANGPKLGEIILVSGTNPGGISCLATTSIIKMGHETTDTNIGGVDSITINGKSAVKGGSFVAADFPKKTVSDADYLLQIGGNAIGTLSADTTEGNDVVINSTSVIAGS
jgi:hypothetical protein